MEEQNKPEQLSSLERFKRRLERRNGDSSDFKSTILPPKDFKVNTSWGEDELTTTDYRSSIAQKTNTFLWRLFWGSSLFFLATVSVAIYVLFFSANIVSGNNIDILIKGPTQIRSGDELNLQTTIINKNKVILNSVNLVLSYPTGTMDPLIPDKELPLWREKLNDINPGQTVDIASRAVIFGGQNTEQEIKIVLEYRIPDSNALFTKEKVYKVTIGSSSLDLALDLPSDLNVGKEFTGTLKVVSNAQSLLRNCTIKIEWPTGFDFESADPLPVESNNTWFLGDLISGTTKEINFTGKLSGQSGDVKPFKITAGFASGEGKDPMTLEYGNLFQTINLTKDFVTAGIFLADDSGRDPIIWPNGTLSGDIGWINNLNDKIINASFDLTLEGSFLNKRAIQASTGFYDSIGNTISWDERNLPGLKEIPPAEGGQASFSLGLLPLAKVSNLQDKEIKLNLTFRGTRIVDGRQTEEIVSQSQKTIKISTLASLTSSGLYSIGPFVNSGPLPPTVGQETTYTINLVVTNTLNDFGNVKIKTVLPPAVKWLGLTSPLDEKVVYNQTSGEVIWDLGTVSAATGGDPSVRSLYFQISFLPGLNQVGSASNLTGEITMEGKDLFTGALINKTTSALSTRITSDPAFINGQEIIVE